MAKKYTGDLFNQTTFDKHVTDDKRWMVGLIAGIDEKIEEVEELIAELREGAVTTKRNQEIADAEGRLRIASEYRQEMERLAALEVLAAR